ncbi:hypothetical protein L3556_04235 [Candidatus Synechococcus calcipolaris G9]|uniref:Uncharacterized protein n=1 Tax=Candidatus Synechococcus calcipolaris G9 TaxID=1497997 RepID=A0ABT6EWI9_9SYNE|nr:hypothetical protein [Candidatus Synechococcus calcipolaris]MDG2990147.1 hypothetical protein [Candidatus Synechococcus calcipolaris G9]
MNIKFLSPLLAIALAVSSFGNLPALASRTRGRSLSGERSLGNRVPNTTRSRPVNIDRSNINRSNINRSNVNQSNINRSNINRSNINQNINRNNIRNTNLSNDINVNRNNVNLRNRVTDVNPRTIQRPNNVNIDRSVNVNRWNRNNIIVNPRGVNRGNWWWNGSRAWYPAPNYWGGGFWGNLAIGVTSAAVAGAIAGSFSNANSNNSPVIVVNSPGGQLFSSYGLVQTDCDGPVVVIYGPSNSMICAEPTASVPAGLYVIDTETLSLIPI